MLNNVIGREIGKITSIDSKSKDIAKKVLDYYYTNGLNIVKETDDGHYVIVKERLSYERYKDDLIILQTLDENGFPPDNKYYNKKVIELVKKYIKVILIGVLCMGVILSIFSIINYRHSKSLKDKIIKNVMMIPRLLYICLILLALNGISVLYMDRQRKRKIYVMHLI